MPRIRQLVGLDLGSRNVRAVWVQYRGGVPRVSRVEQMALPLEAAEPLPLVAAWLEQLGLQRGFAVMALPGSQIVFQPGRLAPGDPRTPAQAAAMEIATFNDMAGDSMVYETTAHEWTPGSRVYLVAMARPAAITRALDVQGPLGIRVADLIPAAVALYRILSQLAGAPPAPQLYLDIGHSQTELAIGTPKGLLFARAVAMGGRAFTDAVAQASGVPAAQAEGIKHRDGALLPESPLEAVLRPVADRWLAQVVAALGVYRGAFGGEPFALGRVVLSGGGAQLRGLDKLLQERLRLPVERVENLPGAAALGAPPACLLAAGLAMAALDSGGAPLSLLPARLRDEVLFREQKPYWMAAAVLGALTLGVFTAGMVRSLNREAGRIEAERVELRKREQLDQGIALLRQRGQETRLRAAPLLALLRNGPAMREVISLVAGAIGPDDGISMICEESSYLPQQPPTPPAQPAPASRAAFFLPGFKGGLQPKPAAPAAKPAAVPAPAASDFGVFIVEGQTPDVSLKSVKALIQRLRSAAAVRQVDLLSDDRVLPPTLPEELAGVELSVPAMRRFVLRLEVVQP